MRLAEIDALMGSVGLPYDYYQFQRTDNTVPDPPYFVWYIDGRDDFYADNINYKHIANLTIELYTDYKSPADEALVESMLETNEITYSITSDDYIEAERLYVVVYEMEVLIDEQ